MTGPKGKSVSFVTPETFNVSWGEAKGNIEIEGKQNSLFPTGPVIMCFIIPPNSKLGSQIYSGFKEHDLITYKSKIHAVVSLGS